MRLFSDKNTDSTASRSVQAWQILIAAAMTRRTYTYQALVSEMRDPEKSGLLVVRPLECIALFCKKNGLPPLTCLVVSKKTGKPSDNEMLSSYEDLDELREKVFSTDWYDIYPPSEEEFRTLKAESKA